MKNLFKQVSKTSGHATFPDYDVVIEKNESSLMIDFENSILRISWKGIVTAETAGFLLASALNEVQSSNISYVLLDRVQLEVFTKGSRLWIKEDFLKSKVKVLCDTLNIKKVASLKPKTSMGSIYAHLISSAIKIVFPTLPLAEFESERQALNWFQVND